MTYTTDPQDPRLGHGVDTDPIPQHDVYLVLSEEERAKGFVRPLRFSYVHKGQPGPKGPLLDLTPEQAAIWGDTYVKYEPYGPDMAPKVGRFWTQQQLDNINKGCGTITNMSRALAETYARNPHFYGATYCCGCCKHLPVKEFIWFDDATQVGS